MLNLPNFSLGNTADTAAAANPPPPPPPAPPPSSGAFVTGLKVGGYGLLGAFGGLASGAENLVGLTGAATNTANAVKGFQDAATAVGQPYADANWTGNGLGGFLSKAAFEGGQLVPGAAATIGAAALTGGGSLAAEGAGGLLGSQALRSAAGVAAFTVPQSIGENVNAANQNTPGGLASKGDVLKAAALGVPVGALQALVPAEGFGGSVLGKAVGAGADSAVTRIAGRGLQDAAVNAIGSGAQQAASDSFNPNLSASDRAQNIVSAAVQGASVGGLMGAAFGYFHKPGPPLDGDAPTASIDQATKGALDPDPQPPAPAAPEPPAPESPEASSPVAQSAPDAAPVAPEPEPEPSAPVPVAQQVVQQLGLKVSKASSLGKVLDASTAQSLPELHNELIEAANADPALADSSKFGTLANSLGVGDPTLPAQVRQAMLDPANADAQAIMLKGGIKSSAQALRPDLHEPLPEAAPPAPVAEPDQPTPAIQNRVEPDAAAERASPAIQTLGPDTTAPTSNSPTLTRTQAVEAPPGLDTLLADRLDVTTNDTQIAAPPEDVTTNALQTGNAADPSTDGPQAITDKVLGVARDAVGDKGGEVSIADIRAALPDVASKDIDNALREIHGDDSDHNLTQNPKGQRAGVDSVSVAGSGKFQKLDLAPAETSDAVQEPGAAAQTPQAQPDAGAPDGGGNAEPGQPAGTVDPGQAAPGAGSSGTLDASGQASLDATAQKYGVTLPDRTPENAQAHDAVTDRLKLFASQDADGRPVDPGTVREAQATFGKVSDPTANGPVPYDPAKFRRSRATDAALAPQDPTARDPAQVAQDSVKTAAAGDLIAAPQTTKDANAPAQQALREQVRSKTAIVETPTGDQVPTAAIGGDPADLAASQHAAADPLPAAGPAEPMAKMPFDRMPGLDNPSILPRADVEAHVSKIAAKLNPEVQGKIHVLSSSDELPKVLRDAAAATGQDLSHIPALYHDGEVYLHADQMRNLGEVEDALSHEVFGHLGTAKRTGPAYEASLSKLYDRAASDNGIEKLARGAGVWAPDDDGHNLVGGAGLKHYLPPEGTVMTPRLKARVMDELIAHSAGATPSALDQVIQTLQDGARKGIVNLLRRGGLTNFARRLDRFTPAELTKWVADSRKALSDQPKTGDVDLAAGATDPRTMLHDAPPTGEAPFMAKVSAQQADVQGVAGLANSVLGHLDKLGVTDTLKAGSRRIRDNLMPGSGLAQRMARLGMSTGNEYYKLVSDHENPTADHLSALGKPNEQAHLDLRHQDRVQFDRVNNVMRDMALSGLDFRKSYEENTWTRNLSHEDNIRMAALHAEGRAEWNKLGMPGKGGKITNGQDIVNAHVTLGQHQWFTGKSTYLHGQLEELGVDVGVNPAAKFAGQDPTFIDQQGNQLANALHHDPEAAVKFSRGQFENLTEKGNKFYADNLAKVDAPRVDGQGQLLSDTAREKMKADMLPSQLQELKRLLDQNAEQKTNQIDQAPYFHIGRQGDNAVGFRIKPELDAEGAPTGRPDPAALKALKDAYAKSHPQVAFSNYSDNPSVFARFVHQGEADGFAKRVQDGGDLRQHIDPEHAVFANTLERSEQADSLVPFLDSNIQKLKAGFDANIAKLPPGDPQIAILTAAKDRAVGSYRASALDILGDNTTRGLEAQRRNVQGSNIDMRQNQADAASVNSRAAATQAFRLEKATLLNKAQDAVSSAAKGSTRASEMQRALNSFIARNDAADTRVKSSFFQNVNRVLHTYTLGASPGYMLMQIAQLPTLTLPELAKHHGFARATLAMAQASADAGKILATMASNGHLFHGGIDAEIMAKSGLPLSVQQHVMQLVNRGKVELSSYSAIHSGVNFGSLGRPQKLLHYANSTAILAEVTARLVTGLAAKRLYDNIPEGRQRDSLRAQHPDAASYAAHSISESMFDWGSYNSPKLFTAGGAAGQLGPTLFKFHGFAPRMLEKVVRESYNGFLNKGNGTSAERAQAQRFVLGHLAAVTALSGTLGLPAASWVGGVATRMSGLFNNGQSYDFEAHFRNFLADTFGKDMGEVIARGVPRYLGADMGQLGDSELLPFTSLLEDHRKLEDAFPSYLSHAWGSAPSQALNMVLAARDMSEGRVSEALARGLPNAARSLARAYRTDEYGETTSTGEKLPVSNSTASILTTALGFTPGDVAEEKERQETYQGLQDDRAYRKDNIAKAALLAQHAGDQPGYRQAMDDGRKFDQDNPGQMFMSQLPGLLSKQMQAQAMGQALGTLNVKASDPTGRGLVGY